jgi:hypothetical protein
VTRAFHLLVDGREQVHDQSALAELMAFREPLYREIANVVVATDGRRVQAVADEIVRALQQLGLPGPGDASAADAGPATNL